jgi:fumarate reductase subunit C
LEEKAIVDRHPTRPVVKASDVNRAPAWLDILQGGSGLLLVLFMWGHMFFVSSILLGADAMYFIARMFEGEFIFGKPYPILVSGVVVFVSLLFVLHAVTAIRKIPASYREYRSFLRHAAGFSHGDTRLWMVQVITGFVLMLLAGAHLYQMLVHPGDIGPYASAERVWSGRWWPFYLVLLISVEIHGGIGLYRLALKWGWVTPASGAAGRVQLRRVKWAITGFFLALGLLTLAAYMKLGYENRHNVGERYVPQQQAE